MGRLILWAQARPAQWALLGALVACYPLSAFLPAAWGRESGILESLQVLVLLSGFVLAMVVFVRLRPERTAMLALWAAPVWLLLAGRELSWGRAWRAVPGFDAAGRALPPEPLWFQPLVWPAAALLIGWLIYSAWHYRIDEVVRVAFVRSAPWLLLLVALGAAAGSTCAEGHMSCHLDLVASRSQVFEEMVELLAYIALCGLQAVVLTHRVPALPARLKPPVDARVKELR
ncbi:hypothetical protein AB2N08_01325 [Massilia aurea]|uniref:hypothetical protein n=1 Tax=Massilia aurea TaxID=373040 RepID=UPI0034628B62